MNKKVMLRILFLVMSAGMLALSSCKEEDELKPAKPVVNITEVGDASEGTVTAGNDLHLEATIVAEGLIARIDVEIHREEGDSFKIEESYTDGKYIGAKNAEFHEHIDIPAEAPAGEYHLHLTVTDKEGQTTTAEEELIIEEVPDNIEINGLTFGSGDDFPDNETGYIGTAPVIEVTSIKAENGVDKIYIMLHGEGDIAFEIDTTYAYNGETVVEKFHKHILIPDNAPAGDYYLYFKVYDKNGKVLKKAMEVEIKETGITVSDLEVGHESAASDIHTEFKVTATDPLTSILVRIYKADAPSIYYYNQTFSEDFASGDVKEYTFHKHLDATGANAGEYVIQIGIFDKKGAYKAITDKLIIK